MSDMLKKAEGKPGLSKISRYAIEEEAKVMDYGAVKHRPHGWRRIAEEKPSEAKWSQLFDALLRHAHAAAAGEDMDPESGFLHLAHVRCNAAFLIEYLKRSLGTDDRGKPGPDCSDFSDAPAFKDAGRNI